MTSIKLYNAKVNEMPLPDTVSWRVFRDFLDELTATEFNYNTKSKKHYHKNFTARNTTASIDSYNGEWVDFYDLKISLHKFLFDGSNAKGFKRIRQYDDKMVLGLNELQWYFRQQSGINDFSVFRSPLSKFHIGLNLECGSETEARTLLEYFAGRKLPYLPNTHWEEDGHYWNCRSYDFDPETPDDERGSATKCFVAYLKDRRRVRLELRFNSRRAIAALVKSKLGRRLELSNEFRSLKRPEVLTAVFWNTALQLFSTEDRARIVSAYDLSL